MRSKKVKDNVYVQLQCTYEERERVFKVADHKGVSVSALIRENFNKQYRALPAEDK